MVEDNEMNIDLLIFMENDTISDFSLQAHKFLAKHFKFSEIVPYSAEYSNVVASVYSREAPSDSIIKSAKITDYPSNKVTQEEIDKAMKFYGEASNLRPYIRMSYEKLKNRIHILPLHSIMPWLRIQNRRVDSLKALPKRISSLIGKSEIALRLLYDRNNRHFHQMKNLLDELAKDQGILEHETVIIVGDHNAPPRIGPFATALHKLYKLRDFRFVNLRKDSLNHSWPHRDTDFTSSHPKMDLDLAFVKNGNKNGITRRVLYTLEGSDHYPIHINCSDMLF